LHVIQLQVDKKCLPKLGLKVVINLRIEKQTIHFFKNIVKNMLVCSLLFANKLNSIYFCPS